LSIVVAASPWQFGWSALVAIGTLALAAGTFFLALQAKGEARSVNREAKKVGEQVDIQREQKELALRPPLSRRRIAAGSRGRSMESGAGAYQ
jgi:lipopolysaccharide export LptBFGC system permease protein LptF